MNGIINVLKPPGMTSFDVVGHLRKVLKTKKIGHTGTLDPGVAGVLPICVGNATKVIEYITDKDKLYRAELTLGISTDTQDSSGEIISNYKVDFSDDQIIQAINTFVGEYQQIPPMYSAVKVDGKKLYELARKGITIDRKSRKVIIYSIEVLNINRIGSLKVLFDVACSKGTYIRTLCSDIGDKLGSGGHMSFLLRLKAGAFEISTALLLDEISALSQNNTLQEKIINAEEVLRNLKEIRLEAEDRRKFMNGVFIAIESNEFNAGEKVRVFDENKSFFAIGEMFLDEGVLLLRPKKSFWSEGINESNLR